MVKQSVQYYFLNKKNNYSQREVEYVCYGDIKKLAILFDYDPSKEKMLRTFVSKLAEDGIACSVASYSQIESDYILREDLVCFRDSDFNIWGASKDNILNRFLEQKYDVLIDLRDKENVVSNYVHRSVKRKFSISNRKYIAGNDIVISEANDIESFTERIIGYLRNLKKA